LIAEGRLAKKRGNGNYLSTPHVGEDEDTHTAIFALLDSMKKPLWFEEFEKELKAQREKRGEAQK
jgi:hypothetical protein